MRRIASFDIGKTNFAQYVEEFSFSKMEALSQKYKALPKSKQRRVKGAMNKDIESLLLETCREGKRITMGVYDLNLKNEVDVDGSNESDMNDNEKVVYIMGDPKEKKTSASKWDTESRRNLFTHLNKYKSVFETCDEMVVEQQYFHTYQPNSKHKSAGTEANVIAIKIGEALSSWLTITFPDKPVTYFPASNKYMILGAPSGMTASERKGFWSPTKAEEIYKDRNDIHMNKFYEIAKKYKGTRKTEKNICSGLEMLYDDCPDDIYDLTELYLEKRQKFDDFSDAIIQCQAYKFKKYVGKF